MERDWAEPDGRALDVREADVLRAIDRGDRRGESPQQGEGGEEGERVGAGPGDARAEGAGGEVRLCLAERERGACGERADRRRSAIGDGRSRAISGAGRTVVEGAGIDARNVAGLADELCEHGGGVALAAADLEDAGTSGMTQCAIIAARCAVDWSWTLKCFGSWRQRPATVSGEKGAGRVGGRAAIDIDCDA